MLIPQSQDKGKISDDFAKRGGTTINSSPNKWIFRIHLFGDFLLNLLLIYYEQPQKNQKQTRQTWI